MLEPLPLMVTLRPVTPQDSRSLWEWRNDPLTREASFNSQEIPFEQHQRWFLGRLNDTQTRIFIIVNSQRREVGYVRFNQLGEEAEVSIALDPKERGKGYGPVAIKAGAELVLTIGLARRIIARIKPSNEDSAKAFTRAGFVPVGVKAIREVEALELVYPG